LPKLAWLSALCLCIANAGLAKDAGDYLEDARDYVVAPLHLDRHDWLLAGEVAAVTAIAYSLDSHVQQHFAPSDPVPQGDPHSLRDSMPMVALIAGTTVAGLVTAEPKILSTASDMTDAVVPATGSVFAQKHAFGQERPETTMDSGAWFSVGDSFPSGHTTATFAAARPFADGRPKGEWSWRIGAYSLGTLKAYARLHDNQHWLSDTAAGAALGMATGKFASHRSADTADEHLTRISIHPLKGGAMLTVSIDPARLFGW
jgi:hypothetical protein